MIKWILHNYFGYVYRKNQNHLSLKFVFKIWSHTINFQVFYFLSIYQDCISLAIKWLVHTLNGSLIVQPNSFMTTSISRLVATWQTFYTLSSDKNGTSLCYLFSLKVFPNLLKYLGNQRLLTVLLSVILYFNLTSTKKVIVAIKFEIVFVRNRRSNIGF